MKEEQYNNRELDGRFGELMKILDRIEQQTIKTNGRVSMLEQWKFIGMGATGILSLIVMPILAWALFTLANLEGIVHDAVDNTLKR